jgi:hypothetical protein
MYTHIYSCFVHIDPLPFSAGFPAGMKRYVCWEEEQDPSLLDPFFFFFFFLVYDEL